MADGADHDPSDLREMTKPVPSLKARRTPALATVKIARPFAPFKIAKGIDLSGFNLATCQFQSKL